MISYTQAQALLANSLATDEAFKTQVMNSDYLLSELTRQMNLSQIQMDSQQTKVDACIAELQAEMLRQQQAGTTKTFYKP